MDYVDTPDGFPDTEHYAVVVFDSVWIPGDERSRTNPGHGYPERTERVVRYISFRDRDEWERWIRDQTGKTRSFVPIRATPARIKTQVLITTEIE